MVGGLAFYRLIRTAANTATNKLAFSVRSFVRGALIIRLVITIAKLTAVLTFEQLWQKDRGVDPLWNCCAMLAKRSTFFSFIANIFEQQVKFSFHSGTPDRS